MKKIAAVVARLNELIEESALADFYVVRARLKNAPAWTGGLLQVVQGGPEEYDGYAFHKGGRSELQFNAGFEEGPYFRYGIAFSLEPSQSLTDPVATLRPKIERFNSLLGQFAELKQMRMWWYAQRERSLDLSVGKIANEMVASGNFIFIGERVKVGSSGVTDSQLQRAASVMASLLPVYERVEGPTSASVPFKVARLCWNTEFWQHPTGPGGKVGGERAFEAQHGFGHEEWLFDHSQLIDGFKYGFIQALNHSHKKYAGKSLNLLLYAIDQKTKARYWVAAIRDIEVLTLDQAAEASRSFHNRGWLRDMRKQVQLLGLNPETLSDANPVELVNLRYKPENLTAFDPPVQFPAEDLPSAYYGTLQDVPAPQSAIVSGPLASQALRESNIGKLKANRRAFHESKEIDLVQKQWQAQLRTTLKKDLPDANVVVETDVCGHQVDVVIERGGKRVFVELKTRSIVKQVIRQALSQLLEYCYWPPDDSRAHALLIVGAGIAAAEDEQYLKLLRDRFSIPVHYLPYRDGHIEGIRQFVDAALA